MDKLKVLEEKLISLVELAKDLKAENAKLAEENAQLVARISMVELSSKEDARGLRELHDEKELTKLVVDDLIKSIDLLVENQN